MLTKKEVNSYHLLDKILLNLSYTGSNPMHQTALSKTFSGFLIVILLLTLIGTGIYCCKMSYEIMGDIIINLVMFGGVWQNLLKTSFFHFKSGKLANLIKRIYTDFWKPDSLNKSQKENLQLIYQLNALLIRVLTVGVTLSIVGHCTTAMLQGNYNMPVNIWLPKQIRFLIDTSPYYRFTQAFQCIFMVLTTFTCALQADLFIATVIAMILAQFKMLKYKLRIVGDLETERERKEALSEIIAHHNFLLKMLADIEDLFSFVVLQLLGPDMLLVVISFLTVLFIDEFPKKCLFAFVGSTAFTEFAMYCFLGQFVENEAASLSNVAYSCNWENVYDTDMRKNILIIIQQSQKQVNITMGKVIILNLENLTTVSRAMLSFFTFVIDMKKE